VEVEVTAREWIACIGHNFWFVSFERKRE